MVQLLKINSELINYSDEVTLGIQVKINKSNKILLGRVLRKMQLVREHGTHSCNRSITGD